MKSSTTLAVIAALAMAPSVGAAQQAPPTRRLGPTTVASTQILSQIATVRQLPDGRLLVNDVGRRQLVLFDTSLATMTVVADSTTGAANSYGPQRGGLIPYRDSTLLVDAGSASLLVIGPDAKIARVMSAPRSSDAMFLTNPTNGVPGIDPKGRLVYRGIARMQMPAIASNGAFTPPTPPDSAPILRVDLATRKLDTAVWVKLPKTNLNISTMPNGGMMMTSIMNPMPTIDEWALLPDGAIAVIRGRDYHVDWVNPDGTMTSSPKIPYDWQRLTDDDKVAVIDSAKKAIEAARATAMAAAGASSDQKMRMEAGTAGAAAAGGARMQINIGGAGADGGPIMMGGGRGGLGPQIELVSPSELPDYRPAFRPGAARPDLDGNVWIQTTQATGKDPAAGFIYDVINRRGELVDRVQVPAGRTVVGFGPGGTVYLSVRDGVGMRVERARLH